MSTRLTTRIGRMERLVAAICQESAVLPTRISERMRRQAVPPPGLKFRFGRLRRLPEHYRGERHVIIRKRLPNRGEQEWVEFQEVAGPDPNPPAEFGLPRYFDIMFVAPYPPNREVLGNEHQPKKKSRDGVNDRGGEHG